MSREWMVKMVILLTVVILLAIGIIWLWLVQAISSEGTRTTQIRFVIEERQGVSSIASSLVDQGIIASERLFTMGVMLESASSSLQAGEYIIPANASIKDVISLFTNGETSDQISIQIHPGQKLKEIAAEVASQSGISQEDFLQAASTTSIDILFPDTIFPVLTDKPASQNLEGYIFPDTDFYYKNATSKDVIFKALTNLENKLTKEDREAIAQMDKTIFEIITLASIVEMESTEKDRAGVAGVFWNRLDIGMALQSDASVNYVTEEDNPRPTTQELSVDSLYNTYQHRGLPPGPISNPSIASIRATINYEETDYLYFLHPQDGSGRTIFSRTLDEHNRNKAIYLD